MAGHIQDRWYRTETGPDGKPCRVKTERYGVGLRYRARYIGPDGTEKSKSFPDRQKRLAEQWLSQIETDMARGQYIDPQAGRLTVRQHAERWLASLTMDPGTFVGTELRIRLHVLPYLGSRTLGSLRPTHIREWLRKLQDGGVAPAYQRVIFANLSTMLTAAVDDRLIPENPCRSSSVRAPKLDPRRTVPWSRESVLAVRSALPEQHRAMVDLAGGCGLRQGEVLGLAVDDVDFIEGVVHVVRQVKRIRNRPVFALPKGGRTRTVPLPESVARSLEEHISRHPPAAVTLPWRAVDGAPVTVSVLFHGGQGRPVDRNHFNRGAWRPALDAAGIPRGRESGMHALRHFYASVLLDAGESIKALSQYLGHHDPGFTLRTYTHLMPSSEKRTREAVNRAFADGPETDDGPTTAQEG
ncbi:putative prophage phiRv2 integrase [Streptomyces sp. RB17]|uniref:tyrosine-type recombinase/integrase n=1 Tax=Streptomyces sp. RB17 TaxID=2585197 RepID=UPI001295A12D|nr:site-specific integrase [Streptomyces sp. RB17]MQY34902.1 putative prophage phiRv2 integrase [Streptomyces sp. RB17]